MPSIPLIKQTEATKLPQFKLYASKFPIWWTHNSIDKPDPTYFNHLEDVENKDGFNWVEVPFTFNFKDQFTGTLIVDYQYYTYFKLVDLQDDKYPNKYYCVESVNKAFNGGYELKVKLDVFTSYGLAFWTTHINNPVIADKTCSLTRTNNQWLLLTYYYYETDVNDLTFNNWMYLDPLLDFSNTSDIALLANVYRNRNDIAYIEKYPISARYFFQKINGNWQTNTTNLNCTEYVINGNSDPSFQPYGVYNSSVRYYVFKGLVGDTDLYWAFWTVKPRQWFNTSIDFMALSSNSKYPNYALSLDYEVLKEAILSSQNGFNSKFIGVFDGPPLGALEYKFGMEQYNPNNLNEPSFGQNNLELAIVSFDNAINFLVSKIYITPMRGNPKNSSYNNFFSIFGAVSDPTQPPLAGFNDQNLMAKKFNDDGEISFLTHSLIPDKVKNSPYILQKLHINNLNYTPLHPMGIYNKRNLQWEPALSNLTDKLPKIEYGRIKMPDILYFTSSGFRLGYILDNVGLSTTSWILPTSLPVANDLFDTYMTQALITQNTSMSIARQYQKLGILQSSINSSSSAAQNTINKNVFGVFNAITGNIFNITRSVLDYDNKQKMYDAQNESAKATIAPSINNSVDKDTCDQLMTSSTWVPLGSAYHYLFSYLNCFNWCIKAKVPLLESDIIYYNNLVYLYGFYVNRQVKFSELKIEWFNYVGNELPHIYYDFDINKDLLKLIYPGINNELLMAIYVIFNNGVRFWKNIPDYSKPWYWLPGNPNLGSKPDPNTPPASLPADQAPPGTPAFNTSGDK